MVFHWVRMIGNAHLTMARIAIPREENLANSWSAVRKDGLAKSRRKPGFVIPVKTGIQCFQLDMRSLDSRLRGNDEFLRVHKNFKELDRHAMLR